MIVQELNGELILYLVNTNVDNVEQYAQVDPFIVSPDSLVGTPDEYDNVYRFQGYQIFQIKDETVSVQDLGDIDRARLVAQCDIKDGITQLINWEVDPNLGASGIPVPTEMVNGSDEGIVHSFRIITDQFAQENPRLINYKKYHYIAISYAHNNYLEYNPVARIGQDKPYLRSRKNTRGGSITHYTGIPSIPAAKKGGTIQNAVYGDGFEITRVDGAGAGGLLVELTNESRENIFAKNEAELITYKKGMGPIDVKVIDPLNLKKGKFEIRFIRDVEDEEGNPVTLSMDDALWELTYYGEDGKIETISSDRAINIENEQLFMDYGISVSIKQHLFSGNEYYPNYFTEPLESSITFSDPTKPWLGGVSDVDGFNALNWIASGVSADSSAPCWDSRKMPTPQNVPDEFWDAGKLYGNILDGTWTAFPLVRRDITNPSECVGDIENVVLSRFAGFVSAAQGENTSPLRSMNNVDVIITSDKSKWSRSPVLEMQYYQDLAIGGARKNFLRNSPSVDKNGNPDGDGTGMGWFPGYAVDIETGDRLNIAFGENSWLGGDNGDDMLWNPSSRLLTSHGASQLWEGST
jgi:hypothetical protein